MMKKNQSGKGDVILFVSLLGLLVLVMYGALSYLEDKQINTEESIVITADQVQSFLWILGNYSSQQSSLGNINGTLGYNESSGVQFYSSEVNYAEIDVPMVNRSHHKLVNNYKLKDCLPFAGSNVNLLHHLCTHPHIILFTPRNANRVKIQGQFCYTIQVIRPFRSTPSLKKALQRKVIVYVGTNHANGAFITECDLRLDWNALSNEMKSAVIRFFDEPSPCILDS